MADSQRALAFSYCQNAACQDCLASGAKEAWEKEMVWGPLTATLPVAQGSPQAGLTYAARDAGTSYYRTSSEAGEIATLTAKVKTLLAEKAELEKELGMANERSAALDGALLISSGVVERLQAGIERMNARFRIKPQPDPVQNALAAVNRGWRPTV